MTDNERDRLILEMSGAIREQGAILGRVDRDVPQLFALHTDLSVRVQKLERARSEDVGWRSGTRASWGTVRWIIGTIIALSSLLAGAGLSCIFRG